jgi:hypothetical protein
MLVELARLPPRRELTTNVVMATSIRLPQRLLERVDARAKTLGVSRNRLLVDTIEASLSARTTWPPEFLALLDTPLDVTAAKAFDDTLRATRRLRSRGKPPRF